MQHLNSHEKKFGNETRYGALRLIKEFFGELKKALDIAGRSPKNIGVSTINIGIGLEESLELAAKKTQTLTRLEGETMSAIWDAAPPPVSVRDILETINQRRKKKLAYNTVHTVMNILKEKKYIKQVSRSGRAHLFLPTVSRRDASKHLIGDLARRLFGSQLQPMIHHMIDDANLSPEQLKELRDWVDEKLSDAGESEK